MSKQQRDRVFHEFSRWGHDEKGWSPQTRKTYYYRVLAAELWLQEHRQVSLIWAKPNDLKAYLWALDVSATNRNGVRNALVGFGGYLEANGYVEVNPAGGLARLPQPRAIPKALNREELSRVLAIAAAQPARDRAVFNVFLYTGMRLSECQSLRWQHLDLEDGWMRFWAKGQKERAIPIHDELLPILREWRRHTNGQDWVFPSDFAHRKSAGKPVCIRTLGRIMRIIGEAAGVRLHPHLMRHTCAKLLLESGNDVRVVRDWLGHENVSTTSIYLKAFPSDLKAAAKRLRVRRSAESAPAGQADTSA